MKYPSARWVRILRVLLILHVGGLFFLLVFAINVLSDNTFQQGQHVFNRQDAEQSGICDRIDLSNVHFVDNDKMSSKEALDNDIKNIERKDFERDVKEGRRLRGSRDADKKPGINLNYNHVEKLEQGKDDLTDHGSSNHGAGKEEITSKVGSSVVNRSVNATVLSVCRSLKHDEATFYAKLPLAVNTFNHSFLIPGAAICGHKPEAVILVHSLHSNLEQRAAIRATWGGAALTNTWPLHPYTLPLRLKLVFIFGLHNNDSWNEQVEQESTEHGDVIMGDFAESYRNMTLKSLLGLKWVIEHCPLVTYLIKSDDDMFLNLPHLLETLRTTNMTRAILGPLSIGAKVYRSGKWKLTQKEFPFNYFPPYESGSCYIIHHSLVTDLYNTAAYVPWLHIDDVYLTGILGKIIGVRHVRKDGFAFWNAKPPKVCDIVNNKITTATKMTPDRLRTGWRELSNRPNCTEPTTPGR